MHKILTCAAGGPRTHVSARKQAAVSPQVQKSACRPPCAAAQHQQRGKHTHNSRRTHHSPQFSLCDRSTGQGCSCQRLAGEPEHQKKLRRLHAACSNAGIRLEIGPPAKRGDIGKIAGEGLSRPAVRHLAATRGWISKMIHMACLAGGCSGPLRPGGVGKGGLKCKNRHLFRGPRKTTPVEARCRHLCHRIALNCQHKGVRSGPHPRQRGKPRGASMPLPKPTKGKRPGFAGAPGFLLSFSSSSSAPPPPPADPWVSLESSRPGLSNGALGRGKRGTFQSQLLLKVNWVVPPKNGWEHPVGRVDINY